MNDTTLAGIVHGMSDAEYHAHDSLSSTEARLLVKEAGPALYRWKKDNPPLIDDSPKFDIGKAVHAKVLGQGAEIVVVDAEDWRTKAAREAREEARSEGKAPLLTREFEQVNAMAETVLAHPTARVLLSQPGDTEVSLFATIDDVPVRARFDFLPHRSGNRTVSVDLKTTVDASKSAFESSVARYEYAVQRAWYLDALKAVTEDTTAEMVFVAVEKEPPYLVAVYQIPALWADKGHIMAAHARETWLNCTRSNTWPGFPAEVQLLDEPFWHLAQFEETYK